MTKETSKINPSIKKETPIENSDNKTDESFKYSTIITIVFIVFIFLSLILSIRNQSSVKENLPPNNLSTYSNTVAVIFKGVIMSHTKDSLKNILVEVKGVGVDITNENGEFEIPIYIDYDEAYDLIYYEVIPYKGSGYERTMGVTECINYPNGFNIILENN